MDSAEKNNYNCDDYGIESDDGVKGLVPYGFNSDSDDSYELPSTSKKRKRRGRVENPDWFGPRNKKRRERGKGYLGRQKVGNRWTYDKRKERRAIGNRCKCKGNVTIRCVQIADDERCKIFTEFWKMSWFEKKAYVNSLIKIVPTKRPRNRKVSDESKRCRTYQYYFRVENTNIRVCKTFFLNTLNIGRQSVFKWVNKPLVSKACLKKTAPKGKNSTAERQCLNSFFNSLPSMESHYCRAKTQKKYLLAEWSSKKKLYDFYVSDWCARRNIRPLSTAVFYQTFYSKNLALFSPKKDLCEICARFSVGHISQEEYNLHQKKKEEARNEKIKDRDEETHVFAVDLQAVLMAPKSQVSSMYFRTKLQVHNLVFFNLKNNKAYCFIWNEVEGGLGAEEFSSIWIYFIEQKSFVKTRSRKKLFFIVTAVPTKIETP